MNSINNQTDHKNPSVIHNLTELHLPENTKCLRILWMYPSTLSIHGGRGDIMALLRFATLAKLPVEIRRIDRLTDHIPLDEADMLYFCAGDLTCMPDVIKALKPREADFKAFAAQGKVIVANGSTGAILAKDLWLLDDTLIHGLGLLGMHWVQRKTVHGDDLWMDVLQGIEVIGNEIKLADVTLEPEQLPFGRVRYGGGNHGDGFEGAVTNNVIYTSCLGPVLVRNPALAMELLRRGAEAAGITVSPEQFKVSPEEMLHENEGLAQARTFIEKKMQKQ